MIWFIFFYFPANILKVDHQSAEEKERKWKWKWKSFLENGPGHQVTEKNAKIIIWKYSWCNMPKLFSVIISGFQMLKSLQLR